VNDNLLLFGSRIVVPEAMRAETLRKITRVTKAFRSADPECQQQFGGQELIELWKILSKHALYANRKSLHRNNHW